MANNFNPFESQEQAAIKAIEERVYALEEQIKALTEPKEKNNKTKKGE